MSAEPDFVVQVRSALDAIPHAADCGGLECDCGDEEAYEAFKASFDGHAPWDALVEWCKTHGHTETCRTRRFGGACCDRDVRLTQAIAAALEAAAIGGATASRVVALVPSVDDAGRQQLWREPALAALRQAGAP